MNRLTLLGTSAGIATGARAASSYLLDLGEHAVLMDIGDGATRNFLASGFKADWVDTLVITHTHADHVCGYGFFVQQRYRTKTDVPLNVYCPEEAIPLLKSIILHGYLFEEWMTFEIVYHPIRANQGIELDGVSLTFHPTSHLAKASPIIEQHGHSLKAECFAVHAVVKGIALLYSADLGSLSDLMRIDGSIDWLLIETSHVKLDELWPWVEERGIRRVILTHIGAEFDPAAVQDAGKFTSAEVIVTDDLMSFAFD